MNQALSRSVQEMMVDEAVRRERWPERRASSGTMAPATLENVMGLMYFSDSIGRITLKLHGQFRLVPQLIKADDPLQTGFFCFWARPGVVLQSQMTLHN